MDYNNIRKLFRDEKSKIYFDARLQYLSDPRLSSFYECIRNARETYTLREVQELENRFNISSWVIWGNDDYAKYNCLLMRDCHYTVSGVSYNGFVPLFAKDSRVTVIDDHNLKEYLVDPTVGFVFNKRDYIKVKYKLRENERALITFSHIVGRNGHQYFDFFSPHKHESFVDAGCLDGETTLSFIKWCNGSFDRVYAFEPNPNMITTCINKFTPYTDKILFYPFALWESETELKFNNSGSKWDARISSDGNIIVPCKDLDSVIGQQRVTFMKFDIEGSEIKALYGAINLIKINKPRLAISVYHNATDLFKIVQYLREIVPDYQFALRHYHSDCIETILYAYTNS